MNQEPMDGVVWDAPSHRGLMGQLGFGRISLPAYRRSNPAERVFEEVRPLRRGISSLAKRP